ncbi:McrB family protein [Kibdelosporangium phytohabitans]|nr:AAA family ATPase [Kibdelosporangium phytohabitans]MBE1462930.1 5-methylcytosine-specific restriction protein B [Kibdelosporangium phytohabitans]
MSSSGKAETRPNGSNTQYDPALELLLRRLGKLDAVLVSVALDSREARKLPPAERIIRDSPTRLADVDDFDGLRKEIGRAQATTGGNQTRQILLRLTIPGYTVNDADRLARYLARPAPTLPSATQDLADDLLFDLNWLAKVIAVLQYKKQMVLYGPPGTGKTYLARKLAQHIAGAAATRLVQFHPSYAYEDFFEGYRPRGSGETYTLAVQDGPLRLLAEAAANDPGRPYVLIIDEINRANLSKVFGELYFLLEYREEAIELQYSPGKQFRLPANIFIIGTMNTADRSIALVDAAMRRRFAFVELHPDHPPVDQLLTRWVAKHGKTDGRAELLTKLNNAIGDDREFKIGPSYLMKPDADHGLDLVWEYSILPLLEEHYYDLRSRRQVHDTFGLDAIRGQS